MKVPPFDEFKQLPEQDQKKFCDWLELQHKKQIRRTYAFTKHGQTALALVVAINTFTFLDGAFSGKHWQALVSLLAVFVSGRVMKLAIEKNQLLRIYTAQYYPNTTVIKKP